MKYYVINKEEWPEAYCYFNSSVAEDKLESVKELTDDMVKRVLKRVVPKGLDDFYKTLGDEEFQLAALNKDYSCDMLNEVSEEVINEHLTELVFVIGKMIGLLTLDKRR